MAKVFSRTRVERRRLGTVSGVMAVLLLLGALLMSTAVYAEKLEVWDWWGPTTPAAKAWWAHVKKTFEASHPGVEVEFVFVQGTGGIYDKLVSAAAGGLAPDVSQMSVAYARGAYEAGLLMPLDKYVDKTPELQPDKFIPFTQVFNHKDGVTYGITHNIDANTLVYNVDLFEEAGLDAGVNAIDSWDEFTTAAEKLTKFSDGGDMIRTGYHTSYGLVPLINWLYANGGTFYDEEYKHLNVATRQGEETLQFFVDLLGRNQTAPPGDGNIVASGRAAMALGGTWWGHSVFAENPELNLRMTTLPMGPSGTERAVTGWGNMIVIPTGAKHPDLAWEWIKYYCGLQGQIDLLQVHQRPSAPRLDLYRNPAWEDAVAQNPYMQWLPHVYMSAKPYPFIKYRDLNNVFSPLLNQVRSHELSPKAALEEAQRLGNQVLSE